MKELFIFIFSYQPWLQEKWQLRSPRSVVILPVTQVSKWSFQEKLAACDAGGCSLGTHQQAPTHPMANIAIPAHLHLQSLCKIMSHSRARHCTNLRMPQEAGKAPKENNIRITSSIHWSFFDVSTLFLVEPESVGLHDWLIVPAPSAALAPLSITCPCSYCSSPTINRYFASWICPLVSRKLLAGGRSRWQSCVLWQRSGPCAARACLGTTWVYTAPN